MSLTFTKLEGLGNDFVLIDDFFKQSQSLSVTGSLARELLDRRLGVGGDQLLWLRPPGDSKNSARMAIFNPDGSEAEMCGNGIRAFALYFHARVRVPQAHYLFETLAGTKRVEVIDDGRLFRVDMGPPLLGPGVLVGGEEILMAGSKVRFFEVNMGNPHAVFFVEDIDSLVALGAGIETHSRFRERTNVEFAQVQAPGHEGRSLRVRVWERGAGLTLACGSGACASAVAALASGRLKPGASPVRVILPGGDLAISWAGAGASVWMTGPAHEVFSGVWNKSAEAQVETQVKAR